MNHICCFAGHHDAYSQGLEERVRKQIVRLIEEKGVQVFWVGNYGRFDRMVAHIIRDIRKEYPAINLILVVPYVTQDMNSNQAYYRELYDSILVADVPISTPTRYKILKCNQYMVDSSSYLICYVRSSYGGAAKTLSYARKRKNVTIINIGEI